MRFDSDAMRSACSDAGLYATDLAEALVISGMPFREAHRRTGELLRSIDEQGRALADLTDSEWKEFGVPSGATMLDPERSVAARTTPGGPSPESVRTQAGELERAIADRRARSSKRS